jgi:hypothetical protein
MLTLLQEGTKNTKGSDIILSNFATFVVRIRIIVDGLFFRAIYIDH